MKSQRLIVMVTLALSLMTLPGYSNDIVTPAKAPTTEGTPSPEVQQMMRRLDEIKAIDVKKLPRSERRALRKEVKEIDQKLQQSGAIYISVGALVLIILLLVLLL